MNAERLHALASALANEIQETYNQLNTLTQALKRQQAEPNEAAIQRQVAEAKSKLLDFLRSVPSNKFSPAWRELLHERNVDYLLGNDLRSQIESIFAANAITPVAVYDGILKLTEAEKRFVDATSGLLSGFEFYEIDSEELKPGECEMGFLIPRKAVGNHLKELGEEFKDLNEILVPFAELTAGGRPQIEVRSISSSAFGLFLDMSPIVAACLATTVERLINAYKTLLEIKTLRNGLANEGMMQDSLKGVDQHAEGVMKKAIESILQDLLVSHGKSLKQDRKHEMKTELRRSLNAIANRIDAGYNIEIRAVPPAVEENSDDSAGDGDSSAKAEYFATIGAAQEALKFIHHDGAPILHLPTAIDNSKAAAEEVTPNEEIDDTSEPPKKRTPKKRSTKKSKN